MEPDLTYRTFSLDSPMAPKDRKRLVYLIFYYTGLAILFPYSMIIAITDFWNYKLRDTSVPYDSSGPLTEAQKQLPSQLAMAGNVPLTALVLLTLVLGHRVGLRTRLLAAVTVETLAIGGVLLLAWLDTDTWQPLLVSLTIALTALCSAANAVFQASFLGNLGRFPANYIGGANDGMGLGTSLPALLALLVLALGPPPTVLGVAGVAAALLAVLLQLPATAHLFTSPFYLHYSGVQEPGPSPRDYLAVLASTWHYQLALLTTFTITLSVHPAVTALVRPSSSLASPWHDKYFVPVCCFLTQAMSDWLGRSLATLSQWPGPGRSTELLTLATSLLRAAFLPLIMLCNVSPSNRSSAVLLGQDWLYVLLLVVFSLLGGFLTNLCYMLAPAKVSGGRREVAGLLLTTALVLGLGLGSLLGPGLVRLL